VLLENPSVSTVARPSGRVREARANVAFGLQQRWMQRNREAALWGLQKRFILLQKMPEEGLESAAQIGVCF